MPKKPTDTLLEDIDFTLDDCADCVEEALEELDNLRKYIGQLKKRLANVSAGSRAKRRRL